MAHRLMVSLTGPTQQSDGEDFQGSGEYSKELGEELGVFEDVSMTTTLPNIFKIGHRMLSLISLHKLIYISIKFNIVRNDIVEYVRRG